MLDIDALLASLSARPDPRALLDQFRPPPRFEEKRFSGYTPGHPSQAAAAVRLERLATELGRPAPAGRRLLGLLARAPRRPTGGVYLDGGFGVGKTHLLASLWHATPPPRAYLSFDELMYFIGLVGPAGAAAAFDGHRLVAVDEWELDDPGNLKLALAFLREVVKRGVFVAVTSNTLPLELGAGRFSQKDFRSEVEELASAFEVVRIEGEDYRHRHFDARPGAEYYVDSRQLEALAATAPAATLHVRFERLIDALGDLHPIRYRELARRLDGLLLEEVQTIDDLPDALRWVHFVDSLYDAGVRLTASGAVPLGGIFPESTRVGPYGKKLSRCLSRLEEMLGEGAPDRDGEGFASPA